MNPIRAINLLAMAFVLTSMALGIAPFYTECLRALVSAVTR